MCARVLVLLLCLLSTACSDSSSAEAMYEKYLQRLSNVLELEIPNTEPSAPLSPYPATRDLVLQSEDIRIGLVDFFSFSECQMLHQISERNSGLGRVQTATVRLRYEMRFYHSLKTCMESLSSDKQKPVDKDDNEWLQIAQDVLARKAKVLPVAYWNATFGSPEMRILLSTGSTPIQRDQPPPLSQLNTDLHFLVQLSESLYAGGPDIPDTQFEQHYYRLQQQKTVGQWLQSLHLSRSNMDQATQLLKQAQRQNRLCPGGKKTPRAGYLHNVFMKFYVAEVQPYLGLLHRSGQTIHPQLEALVQAQKLAPPEAFKVHYRRYLDPNASDGLWQQFKRSLDTHTKAWQGLLTQCGMMPGQPTADS